MSAAYEALRTIVNQIDDRIKSAVFSRDLSQVIGVTGLAVPLGIVMNMRGIVLHHQFSGKNLHRLVRLEPFEKLVTDIKALPDGAGDQRETAVENAVETLLGAVNLITKEGANAADFAIAMNLIMPIVKGASVADGLNDTVYRVTGQKLLFSKTYLPLGALWLIIEFLCNSDNWMGEPSL